MATITFTNNTPFAGLDFNPGLEELLDASGTVSERTAAVFEITNNDDGPFNGFRFRLTSSAGDFTYTNGIPTAGKIDGITVRAPDANGTIILQVTPGANGFGDQKLVDFHKLLFDPNTPIPESAIFAALNNLLSHSNVVQGSDIADHATGFGFFNFTEINGGGGNDVLSAHADQDARLIGGAGNDLIRVGDGEYEVHGANADGTGGEGQTNTLEVLGFVNNSADAFLGTVTNIDRLRFVAGDDPVAPSVSGAFVGIEVEASQIGAGRLSETLAVQGSTTNSPSSQNEIEVFVRFDETATTGVNIDLSKWTFTNWDETQSEVDISTNAAARELNDTVTGTMVADDIATFFGDDVIRGGRGADQMHGGAGNDTFVYGLNEAADGEFVDGGFGPAEGTNDRVLILADNDFTGASFFGIDQFVFAGKATATFSQNFLIPESSTAALAESLTIVGDSNVNTVAFQVVKSGAGPSGIDASDLILKSWSNNDRVTITGINSSDTISGTSEDDIIDGREGGDFLQGNKGGDAFVFDVGFGNGVDHIADFHRKQGDSIQFDHDFFKKLKVGDLKKSAFTTGTEADDKKDRIIYDKDEGVVRFDDDGTGKHKAHIVAVFDDAASLKAADIFVI